MLQVKKRNLEEKREKKRISPKGSTDIKGREKNRGKNVRRPSTKPGGFRNQAEKIGAEGL